MLLNTDSRAGTRSIVIIKCDPICEIQAKVSKSNYEITTINFTMIMPYSVNIKDIKVTFLQNVLYLIKDGFMQKTVNRQKMTLAVFSQAGSEIIENSR